MIKPIEDNTNNFFQKNQYEVKGQDGIVIEEIPLLKNDPEVQEALQLLCQKGYTSNQLKSDFKELVRIPVTSQRKRLSQKNSLDIRVKTEVGKILTQRNINPEGYDLDKKRLGKTNFVSLKSLIDLKINNLVNKNSSSRDQFTLNDLSLIDENFSKIVSETTNEVFNGKN